METVPPTTTESARQRIPVSADTVTDQRVRQVVDRISAGQAVIVAEGAGNRYRAALTFPADQATTALMAFVVRHSCGFVCVAMRQERCDELDLVPLSHRQRITPMLAQQCVTVDARDETTTGISAADRARTARLLGDPDSTADRFTRPGHVVPLRTHERGVLGIRGCAEATVDLSRLAGMTPTGVIAEIVSPNEPTRMANDAEIDHFASEHDLAVITVDTLAEYLSNATASVVLDDRFTLNGSTVHALGIADLSRDSEYLCLIDESIRKTDVPTHILSAEEDLTAHDGLIDVIHRHYTERGITVVAFDSSSGPSLHRFTDRATPSSPVSTATSRAAHDLLNGGPLNKTLARWGISSLLLLQESF